MATLTNTLDIKDLAFIRGERILFKKLNFKLVSGKILYVQGENGSGKTTLLRTLCGLSQPEVGQITWNEKNITSLAEDYYGKMLYIGHLASIKGDLTATENLKFNVSLAGNAIDQAQALNALEKLNVARSAELPTRMLSQGQKRRVALAQLWLQDGPAQTPLWILDEPFTALDTVAIKTLTQHIEAFVNNGGMVVFTSHQTPRFKSSLVKALRLD